MSDLAPIAVSTYIRLSRLQQTIRALQNNTLAKDSEIYILSDAAKAGDENKVREIRKYLQTISGFKKVHIIERKVNGRLENNRGGMRALLQEYGKIIFLEEDIKTSPVFLLFMNQALDKYENNKRIFSVTGYCPPISIPDDYSYDLFFMRRFNAWGLGIWYDRFKQVKYIQPADYKSLEGDEKQVQLFVSGGGKDMLRMLKKDVYGEIDAFDVKAMYTQFLSDQYTAYPTKSLTFNLGMDGTGVHCGKTKKFDVPLSNKRTFLFPDDLTVDQRIIEENLKFRDYRSFANRMLGILGRLTWKKNVQKSP